MTVSEKLKINPHLEAQPLDREDIPYTKFKLLLYTFAKKYKRERTT